MCYKPLRSLNNRHRPIPPLMNFIVRLIKTKIHYWSVNAILNPLLPSFATRSGRAAFNKSEFAFLRKEAGLNLPFFSLCGAMLFLGNDAMMLVHQQFLSC